MRTQYNALARTGLRTARSGRLLMLLALALLSGCAAMHPIKGVPASYLPAEFLGPSRDGLRPINPMLLTRSRPPEHLVDAGDVLSIYIPGILGTDSTEVHTIGEVPPINYPTDIELPPTIGFPITVRGDGTVSLPQVSAIPVRSMTLAQVEAAIRQAYMTPRQILPAGRERILVSLQRPRDFRVLVVREDSSIVSATSTSGQGSINLGNSRRGTARIVNLKAYENDVLHALSRVAGVDGLPGLDAEGAIYVIRRNAHGMPGAAGGMGCGMSGPWLGAESRAAAGMCDVLPAYATQPVIRYQSPADDYRSHAAGDYSGHSFSSPRAAGAPSGRYGAPAYSADPGAYALAPSPQPSAMTGGRYGTPAIAPGNGPAGFAAPPPMSMTSGRYGSALPASRASSAGPGPAAAPTNWTSIPSPRDVAAMGRYGSGAIQQTQGAMDSYSPQLQPLPTSDAWSAQPLPFGPGIQVRGPSVGYSAPSAGPLPAQGPLPYSSGNQPAQVMSQPVWPAQPSPPPVPYPAFAAPAPQPMQMNPAPAMYAGPAYSAAPALPAGPGSCNLPTDDYFASMMATGLDGTIDGPNVIRIPVRVGPGDSPQITEQDVTLEDGDIVFIEARGSEVFYTGGLLGGGQYTLPRDYDLRALEALSIAQSVGSRSGTIRSSGGVSALNQDVTISASKLIIRRKLADGTTLPIEVDLNRAKRDMTGCENIIIQPGDYLLLQYSCLEAVGAFFERHLLEGALFGLATSSFTTGGK